MPAKSILKQSRQSLAARGLPSRNSLPKKNVQKAINSTSESDQIGSVHVGLDRCASLLAAMLDSPTPTERKTKKHAHKRPGDKPKRKQFSSTPISRVMQNKPKTGGSNCDQHGDLSSENNTVDELIEEKQQLKQYLNEIALDKHKIQETYQTIVQKHLEDLHHSNDAVIVNDLEKIGTDNNRIRSSPLSALTAGQQSEKKNIKSKELQLSKSQSSHTSRLHSSKKDTPKFHNSSMIETNQSPTFENNAELHVLMRSITKKLTLEKKKPTVELGTPSNEPITTTFESPMNTERNHLMEQYPLSDMGRQHTSEITIKEFVDRSVQNDSVENVEAGCKNCTKTSKRTDSGDSKFNSIKNDMQRPTGQGHIHLTTLSYMLKELHTILGDKRDLELDRLLNEIDHIVELLPFVIDNSSGNFQAELNFALQPVRQENVELRRKLRIANQQMKGANLKVEELKSQAENTAIQNQNASDIIEDLKRKLFLGEKNTSQISDQIIDVCKVMDELKLENQKLLQSLSDKEANQFKERTMWLNEKSTLEKELSRVQSLYEQNQMLLQATTKDLTIVDVSTKQKDAEIERLSKLNEDLQQSVSKLLREIHCERRNMHQVKFHQHDLKRHFHTRMDHYQYIPVDKTTNDRKFEQATPTSTTSSSTLLGNAVDSIYSVDGTLSTLGTYDNLDFQRDLDHLDEELNKIQHSLKNTQGNILCDGRV